MPLGFEEDAEEASGLLALFSGGSDDDATPSHSGSPARSSRSCSRSISPTRSRYSCSLSPTRSSRSRSMSPTRSSRSRSRSHSPTRSRSRTPGDDDDNSRGAAWLRANLNTVVTVHGHMLRQLLYGALVMHLCNCSARFVEACGKRGRHLALQVRGFPIALSPPAHVAITPLPLAGTVSRPRSRCCRSRQAGRSSSRHAGPRWRRSAQGGGRGR